MSKLGVEPGANRSAGATHGALGNMNQIGTMQTDDHATDRDKGTLLVDILMGDVDLDVMFSGRDDLSLAAPAGAAGAEQ